MFHSVRLVRNEFAGRTVRRVFNAFGLNVTSHRPAGDGLGIDAMADIRKLLSGVPHPTVFDVEANIGQSVKRFSQLLPGCLLHVFEPSPTAFAHLTQSTRRIQNVWLSNAGVGSAAGTAVPSP